MHQNSPTSVDGIYGSKDVEKTLLTVSTKIGEARSKKWDRIFSTPWALIVTKILESLINGFFSFSYILAYNIFVV